MAFRNVSLRLLRPNTRISAMLDPLPMNQEQVHMEALFFEDDCLEPDIAFPESLKLMNKQFEVTQAFLKRAPEKILFYIFYNMPFDK